MPTTPNVGRRAARVIVDEFIRHPGPKTGLITGAGPGHPVLAAAVDALLPDDKLTIIVDPAERADHETYLSQQGAWVTDRVTLVTSAADAAPADVTMIAEPIQDEAAEFTKAAVTMRELTNPGGVLTIAAPLWADATEEITSLVAENGTGSDLVLLNKPPLRIHRLRFQEAPTELADRVAPTYRPSSVPLTSRMNIDSNGLAAGAALLGLAGLTKKARPKSKLWMVPAAAAIPAAAFFRDPQRVTDDDPGAIVGSGDGKVLSVERINDDRFGQNTEWLRIAVFLSILDVHVNRSPVSGRVIDVFRESGGYAPAMNESAEHNVACYTVLDTTHGPVAVAQRTGLIARRIINRTQPKAMLAKGERYGLIRFGSRTDVYLPADAADALVAPGERVVGGETVIARWRE